MHLAPLFALVALSIPAFADSGTPTTWSDLGGGHPGVSGVPQLTGSGELAPGGSVTLNLTGSQPAAPAFLVAGLSRVNLPFLGGILLPDPTVVLPAQLTDANGDLSLNISWPSTAPTSVDVFYQYWVLDSAASEGVAASNGILSAPAGGPESGTFPSAWINGADCATEPNAQVHKYNDDFYIIRQSLCTSSEAPFLYLIFGEERALLLDSGAGGQVNLAFTIDALVNDWAAAHGKTDYGLTVAHTHGHGDHVAGDTIFQGRPNTTVVGVGTAAVQSFFGFTNWPTEQLTYDLGGRIIDLIPTPGHESAHLTFYDRRTANLMTGDTMYPGRIYIFSAISQGNWPIFQASMQRLVDFTANNEVCWLLGAHIEMTTTPGVDFGLGASTHPNEHILQLETKHIIELSSAAWAMGATPSLEVHPDFIIYPFN